MPVVAGQSKSSMSFLTINKYWLSPVAVILKPCSELACDVMYVVLMAIHKQSEICNFCELCCHIYAEP